MRTEDAASRLGMTMEDFLALAAEAGVSGGTKTVQRVSGRGVLGGARGPTASDTNWTDNQLNKIGIFRREKREKAQRDQQQHAEFSEQPLDRPGIKKDRFQ